MADPFNTPHSKYPPQSRDFSEAMSLAFKGVCPRCTTGKVYKSFFSMNTRCPECDYFFEREPGYFLGATSISYVCGFFFVLPVFLYLLFTDSSFTTLVLVPTLQAAPITPFLFHYSRLIWIHLDFRINPV